MGRSKFGGRKRVMLATTLAITVAASVSVAAQAQQLTVPEQSGAARLFRFDIAAQPLPQALNEIGRTTRLAVVFTGSRPFNVTGRPVQGNLTSSQALAMLLAGTGITYRFTNARTVTIDTGEQGPSNGAMPAGAISLDTINVQGSSNPNSTMTPLPAYAGGQVATGAQVGMLGNRSVMNTPFNQTSFTAKTIEDRQAVTISDALQYDPSVRANATTVWPAENVTIRGFNVSSNDTSVNGLYGIIPNSFTSTAFVERVEVLKGPSALLNGMPLSGSVGGTINLVTKRATDDPISRLTTSYASDSRLGTHLDFGRRFGPNKEWGVRFNGSYAKGNTPIQDNSDALGIGVLGLDYRGERLRVSVDAGHQDREVTATQNTINLPSGLPVPRAPDNSRSFVGPWTYVKSRDTFGMARAEFDVTSDIMIYGAVGAHEQVQEQKFGFPQILASNGNFAYQPYGYSANFVDTSAQAGLRARFETGFVKHSLSANFGTVRRDNKNSNIPQGSIQFSNIYNPVYANPSIVIPTPLRVSITQLTSYGVADTMSILDERVQLTLGVRHQQVTTDSYSSGVYRATYDSGKWSPAAALVVKPWSNVALYANYIQGLQSGTVVNPPYANAGEVLPPQPTEQKEVGVKVDWGQFTTTLSAFEIEQPLSMVVAATNTLQYDGRQRNRGIEFNFFGEIIEGVRLLGGAMWLESVQAKTANAAAIGKIVSGAPRLQTNVGLDADIPFVRGLSLNGLVVHTSSQYVDALNTQQIPSWTRLDIGMRYKFEGPWDKPMIFRFGIENVANQSYWASAANSYLMLNSPRTFRASLAMDF